MKQLTVISVFLFFAAQLKAQDIHITRNGKITFFSHTNIEDIEAANNEVTSTINTKTGAVQFLVLIKGFQFKKAAMQQHFNSSDYMNSDVFPKADFKGTIKDVNAIDFSKDGTYQILVEGNLTMHGVTNKVAVRGSVTVKGGKLSSNAKFSVKLADYKVTVPSIATEKVAQAIDVTVICNYQLYKG
jgi:polyisoprenoid-binding protein YceI